jgi:hypothetical protein
MMQPKKKKGHKPHGALERKCSTCAIEEKGSSYKCFNCPANPRKVVKRDVKKS